MGITFVTDAHMAALNRFYRGRHEPTDVLSVAFQPQGQAPGDLRPHRRRRLRDLGDTFVGLPEVVTYSDRHGLALESRLRVLLAHSIAHLVGHTHGTRGEYQPMRELEERMVFGHEEWLTGGHPGDDRACAGGVEGRVATGDGGRGAAGGGHGPGRGAGAFDKGDWMPRIVDEAALRRSLGLARPS